MNGRCTNCHYAFVKSKKGYNRTEILSCTYPETYRLVFQSEKKITKGMFLCAKCLSFLRKNTRRVKLRRRGRKSNSRKEMCIAKQLPCITLPTEKPTEQPTKPRKKSTKRRRVTIRERVFELISSSDYLRAFRLLVKSSMRAKSALMAVFEELQEVESQGSMVATYVEDFHDAGEVAKMRYSPLGKTGMEVSAVGFGASPLGNAYTAEVPSDKEHQACVLKALKSGINYIDTAPWYGQGKSEEKLGQFLKDIPRSSYYIATKVGRYEKEVEAMFDFSAERVTRSVDESLSRLGLGYVDLIQVHDVEFAANVEIILNETLPALQRIKEAGKARFIGITGYPISTLREIVEQSTVKIDTVLSYCHLDLNDSSLLDHIAYFEEKGIGVISASPLSMALLTSFGPPVWHPASAEVRGSCQKAAQYCQENGVDIAKLAMHFSVSQERVATVLVGMDRPSFVERNLDVVHKKLNKTEENVLKHIQKEFLPPGISRTWEGVEVAKYWKKLKARQAKPMVEDS